MKNLILNVIPVFIGMLLSYLAELLFNFLFPVVEEYIDDPAIVGVFLLLFPFICFLFLVLVQYLFITNAIKNNLNKTFKILMLIVFSISVIFFIISYTQIHNLNTGIRVFSEFFFGSFAYVIGNLLTAKILLKVLKNEK